MPPPTSSEVMTANALIIIPAILLGLLVAVVLILRLMLKPEPDVVALERTRYDMYDAGNPPLKKDARKRMPMQYLGYLIMFLAVEPAVILFAILTIAPQALYGRVLLGFLVMIAVYTPLLVYALREARKVEAWSL
ncbi:MAG: NADH-quinone oxidoreductase subunit A [Desulfurococcales archaeon]|nr:NADH-quinone oxidoreductase subunit A [Desulfurococcales archaeon]